MSKVKEYEASVNVSKLTSEIAEIFSDISSVSLYHDEFNITRTVVTFNEDKDSSQWVIVDSIVETHELVSLEDLKRLKNQEIDQNTDILIEQGCNFDGKVFSLSIEAQVNWVAVTDSIFINLKANTIYQDPAITDFVVYQATEKAVIDSFFPLDTTLKDDSTYVFNDYLTYKDFFNTAFTTVKAHLESGRVIKEQVALCTTIQELGQIEDTRL